MTAVVEMNLMRENSRQREGAQTSERIEDVHEAVLDEQEGGEDVGLALGRDELSDDELVDS